VRPWPAPAQLHGDVAMALGKEAERRWEGVAVASGEGEGDGCCSSYSRTG
jgi:hypothetical protein